MNEVRILLLRLKNDFLYNRFKSENSKSQFYIIRSENFLVFLGQKYLSVCKSKESLWIDIWFEEFDSNFVFIYQQELSGPTDSGDSEEREKVISKLCF